MTRRVVWSVDWPWLAVLWPVLLLKGLVWVAVVVPWEISKWIVKFYKWCFTGWSRT